MLTICAAFALLTVAAASPLLAAEAAQRRFLARQAALFYARQSALGGSATPRVSGDQSGR